MSDSFPDFGEHTHRNIQALSSAALSPITGQVAVKVGGPACTSGTLTALRYAAAPPYNLGSRRVADVSEAIFGDIYFMYIH